MRMLEKAEKAESSKNKNDRMTENQKACELDRAFMFFTNSCGDQPDFAMAFYKRGKCYMLMHDYKRALYDFSAAFFNHERFEAK